MARVLIVTQGPLAQTLVEGARTIAGTSQGLSALTLGWDEGLDEGVRRLKSTLDRLEGEADIGGKADEGVLILTDVPGGTPFNVAMRLAEPGRVEVLSGVNLPMAVRVCCPGCGDLSVSELAGWLEEKGRQSICRGQAVKTGSEARDHGSGQPDKAADD